MLLKNVTKEVVEIRYDGMTYAIPPSETINIETLHPGADFNLQINLAEQFERGTGGKLARVATPGGIPSKEEEDAKPEAAKEAPRGRRRIKRG